MGIFEKIKSLFGKKTGRNEPELKIQPPPMPATTQDQASLDTVTESAVRMRAVQRPTPAKAPVNTRKAVRPSHTQFRLQSLSASGVGTSQFEMSSQNLEGILDSLQTEK